MQSAKGSRRAANAASPKWALERNETSPATPIENVEKLGIHTMPDRKNGADPSSCAGIQAWIAPPHVSVGTLGRKS